MIAYISASIIYYMYYFVNAFEFFEFLGGYSHVSGMCMSRPVSRLSDDFTAGLAQIAA